MSLVSNNVNQLSDEELYNDSVNVFREDNDKIQEDVESLQRWIQDTGHMKTTRHDEVFLRFFLRGCNYSLEDTKTKLDLYFTAR